MALANSDIRAFWWLASAALPLALPASAVLLVALRKLRVICVANSLYTDHK